MGALNFKPILFGLFLMAEVIWYFAPAAAKRLANPSPAAEPTPMHHEPHMAMPVVEAPKPVSTQIIVAAPGDDGSLEQRWQKHP
jgi:hypothetical protein